MTKVLVIDDEAQIRRFLRAGFELHGHTVLEAENAAAGLMAATMKPIDLLFWISICPISKVPRCSSASVPGRTFR
jgi:DNA-binding response OmpR family regulator